jgi:hypothetical protein
LGEVVICDFNTSPASCIVPKTHGPDGVLVEAEPAPSGPGIRPGQVLSTGAVLVEAEPAPATPDPILATTGDLQVTEPVATEDPGTSEVPADQVSPATEQVLVAEPAVVEVVEDDES